MDSDWDATLRGENLACCLPHTHLRLDRCLQRADYHFLSLQDGKKKKKDATSDTSSLIL